MHATVKGMQPICPIFFVYYSLAVNPVKLIIYTYVSFICVNIDNNTAFSVSCRHNLLYNDCSRYNINDVAST